MIDKGPVDRLTMTEKHDRLEQTLVRARDRVHKRLAIWSRREERFALTRLITAAIVLMILSGLYAKMSAAQVATGWLLFFGLFYLLSRLHRRLQSVRERCEGVFQVLVSEQQRLQRDWEHLRQSRTRRRSERWHEVMTRSQEHPYRSDLDLNGSTQLWLDTCTLPEGSERLSRTLLECGTHPPSPAVLEQRRSIVTALAAQSQALRRWESYRLGSSEKEFELPVQAPSPSQEADSAEATHDRTDAVEGNRLLSEVLLGVIALGQLWIWTFHLLPAAGEFLKSSDASVLNRPLTLFFPVLILGAVIWESWKKKIQSSEGLPGLRELKVLAALEDVAKRMPASQAARLVPVSEGRRFKFLRTTFELGEVRRNPIAWLLFNVLLPYDALTFAVTLLAHRLIEGQFRQWWQDVVAFDFHCALARVKLENREFVWAQDESETISAVGLGHPLIRKSERVGNDFVLNSQQRCMMLTGSNMAGKSTLLRSLAFNTLLNQMGTVVCARVFASPRIEVLCAIQVTDSLESGASYFYAEVKRLAGLLRRLEEESQGDVRRLFLIDEIFRGTNNRERFLGSWQVVAALLSTGAFGVLTTHDLALTDLEKDVSGVRNYHLRETVGENGLLDFDYILRSGPCPTTNALIIMQQAGLPVKLDFNPSAEMRS